MNTETAEGAEGADFPISIAAFVQVYGALPPKKGGSVQVGFYRKNFPSDLVEFS